MEYRKSSGTFADPISNIKNEGHPPAWYALLWLISKFTHNLIYVQVAHEIIATLAVFIILIFAVPVHTKILMPFGHYFYRLNMQFLAGIMQSERCWYFVFVQPKRILILHLQFLSPIRPLSFAD